MGNGNKKIILCFDGTANDPGDAGSFADDGSISNVLKMHLLFGGSLQENGKIHPNMPGQQSFYYSGIGTYGSWMRKLINQMFAPTSFGLGDLDKIIENAANDLKATFQQGDAVYIVGFSRGAAIARMFAAKIQEHCPLVDSVRFLGVFDTVAAIKGSRDLNAGTFPASGVLFEDGTLSKHVEKAVHLVAIDERRIMFQPTLFNHDPQKVEEVWFPGVHSDIGGGYWFDGLSDIALDYMLEKCEAAGLQRLNPQDVAYDTVAAPSEDEEEDIRLCHDDIEIRPIAHGLMHEQHRAKVIKEATLARRAVRVSVGDEPSEEHTPLVHHTVIRRFRKVTGYRPIALRDVKYRVVLADGTLEEGTRHGIAGLRKSLPGEKDDRQVA